MPVVGRRDAHRVDPGVLQDVAEVGVRRALGAVVVVLVDRRGAVLAARLVDVADRDDADVLLLEELLAEEAPLDAGADHGDRVLLAGLELAHPRLGRRAACESGGRGRSEKKTSAVYVRHFIYSLGMRCTRGMFANNRTWTRAPTERAC